MRGLRLFLRSPRTIVAEVAAVALAAALSTAVPSSQTAADRARQAAEHPLLAAATRALGLDHLFRTWWFLGLWALAGASLALVLVEQWRRLFREWAAAPSAASFRAAPLRAEFRRPARGRPSRLETRHRLGLLGSPLFHLGLLVVILAGAGRMLLGAEAVVHLHEGEVLEPRPGAFGGQWAGPLARPVSFAAPVLVRELDPRLHPGGGLERFTARVAVLGGPAPREESMGINAPLDLEGGRLYLSGRHGCAALLELEGEGRVERVAVLLEEEGPREFAGGEAGPGGLRVRLRARAGPGGERPGELELRALRQGALLAVATLRPGEQVALPGGGRAALGGLRWWARFVAARDVSAWPAALGAVLALAGAILMFGLVKVDEAVLVEPEGDGERVVVALRPQRFAPLFAERFRELVREEGGSEPRPGAGPG